MYYQYYKRPSITYKKNWSCCTFLKLVFVWQFWCNAALKVNFVLNSEISTHTVRLEQGWSPLWGKQHTQADFSKSKLHVNMATTIFQGLRVKVNWLPSSKKQGESSCLQICFPAMKWNTDAFLFLEESKDKMQGRSHSSTNRLEC